MVPGGCKPAAAHVQDIHLMHPATKGQKWTQLLGFYYYAFQCFYYITADMMFGGIYFITIS